MPQKLRCQVIEVLEHGERVYSVLLKPESPAPHFLPGQFLHLALDEYTPGDFWPDSRIFSIASSPTERKILRITYAVKGKFTARMEKRLKPAVVVWIKMPYGEFIVRDDREVCLVAGGTGVTAFTAFIAGLPAEHSHRVHLFYGARCPNLLVYRPLVEAAAQRCSSLDVHFFAEQEAARSVCQMGRINASTVFSSVPDPLSVTFYLAGPPTMIRDLTSGLGQCGVPVGHMVADAWE